MSMMEYVKDKAGVLILNMTGMLLLSFFLSVIGNSGTDILLIVIVWTAIIFVWMSFDYDARRRYFHKLMQLLEELDERYLISEVMEKPHRIEDQIYREVLRKSNKSVIEKIHELETAQREYKEYIESWIHEVKTPLTAMELICENHPGEETKHIRNELLKVDGQVEQVLYYARMERTYQDYRIHPVDLRETVIQAVKKNRQYFIQNQMQVMVEMETVFVSTDEKWVGFLLDQIFLNAIEYRKQEEPVIRLSTERGENSISLIVEDHGVGIAKEDIGRIFQKGFTGKNGRSAGKSTGIGLYLCSRLCEKLGIGITCRSEEGAYTKMILTFPDSNHHKIFQN